jgi:hypothetical protein
MYYHIQLVNFVCHDIHRSLILIIVIKTAPFLHFLIRPNVYIFTAPLYCFLSPHFIQIRHNVERHQKRVVRTNFDIYAFIINTLEAEVALTMTP